LDLDLPIFFIAGKLHINLSPNMDQWDLGITFREMPNTSTNCSMGCHHWAAMAGYISWILPVEPNPGMNWMNMQFITISSFIYPPIISQLK